MRKFLRYSLYFFLCILILLTAGFFIPRKWEHRKSCDKDSVGIIVGTNGYHTSFILPVRSEVFDWTSEFPLDSQVQHIEFGWGNQQFYMSRNFSVKATLRALFPSETVMHVVYLDKSPEQWFRAYQGKSIYLCEEDYRILVQYVINSFLLDEQQKKIYLGEGLYGPSAFYKGQGNYHALETCNTWVARGLRAADVNTPLWGGTAPAIMRILNDEF